MTDLLKYFYNYLLSIYLWSGNVNGKSISARDIFYTKPNCFRI